ncbi:hypothetical protein BFC22_04070 [Carnobacterium divergens]|uniref:hypothetical protein n=1 Tax=Carnobacterium divergens TaxID=2748 RepID=UPI000E72527F|nr:hypothetical protein [Carnobacterium divergens]ANZ99330.1 hypothetical protein BFC22_04070 [Carnobacterium divergens]
MKLKDKVEIAEIYSKGHKETTEKTIRDNNILYGSLTLNVAGKKRYSDLAKKVRELGDNFVSIEDKQSFMFLDKKEKELYIFTSKNNLNHNITKFVNERYLSYITGLITLLGKNNEESSQTSLFDAENYQIEDEDVVEEAKTKVEKLLKNYGDIIKESKILIVTRDSSLADSTEMWVYEYSSDMKYYTKENWGLLLPAHYNNFESAELTTDRVDNSSVKERKIKKHAKLKKRDTIKN